MELHDCLRLRRDTRHFLAEAVPEAALDKAFAAAHHAPSVGLSEPWRFVRVLSADKRAALYQNYCTAAENGDKSSLSPERRALLKSLKLEAIKDAPELIGVFCERPIAGSYTIGVQGTQDALVWSCVCAVQNFWLSLTAQGYSAGWVTILDLSLLSNLLGTSPAWEPLGLLCVGRPADHYGGIPMLEQVGWKTRSAKPVVVQV
jgi:5,6-dimethylbenzimidazole synthase